jgi:hypothetical protein
MRAEDRVRLAEAFRLAEQVREPLWAQWSQAPFAVLLVTPEHEFLVRHPRPTAEFRRLGYDSLLQSDVHVRPRQFPPQMAATFPAVGVVPTIVLGQPEHTGFAASRWVLTLLHEHFHQLQYSTPGYYAGVEALGLSGGDETGMWMLNYAFPYDSARVQARFGAMSSALATALDAAGTPRAAAALAAFVEAKGAFRTELSEPDYRYFDFQVWQEGVARYTEYQAGRRAERYRPEESFLELPGATSFAEAAESLGRSIRDDLRTGNLGRDRRVAFYAVGAAMALLLDDAAPGWRSRYFEEPFQLDSHFRPGR